MTRVAWFHCFNGVAGDMTLASLLDAGAPVEAVRDAVGALGLDGWTVDPSPTQRCGIASTYAGVQVDDHAHEHDAHDHDDRDAPRPPPRSPPIVRVHP